MNDLSARTVADRSLYLCLPARPDIDSFLPSCITGGVDLVQLRDKQLDARNLAGVADRCLRICSDFAVPLIVNDRPDIALQVGTAGVHVGQDDVSPVTARSILGPHAIIGRSTHTVAELERAATEPVDYISAGPVEPTPTKPGRPGTGFAYIETAVETSTVPVFVTGGVSPATVPALATAGVRHFVVVRYLTEAPDPAKAARELRDAIDRAIDRES